MRNPSYFCYYFVRSDENVCLQVLIEDDPQFEGFFVYVLGHRVSFMGKHMNAEVGIDSRVGFNIIINLFWIQFLKKNSNLTILKKKSEKIKHLIIT